MLLFDNFSRILKDKATLFNQGFLSGMKNILRLFLCLECRIRRMLENKEMLEDSWREVVIYSSKEAWRTHTLALSISLINIVLEKIQHNENTHTLNTLTAYGWFNLKYSMQPSYCMSPFSQLRQVFGRHKIWLWKL